MIFELVSVVQTVALPLCLSRVAPWRATEVLINSCIRPAIVGQCQRNMVQACALAVKSKLAMVDRENLSGSAKARRQAKFARDAKHRLRQRTHGCAVGHDDAHAASFSHFGQGSELGSASCRERVCQYV